MTITPDTLTIRPGPDTIRPGPDPGGCAVAAERVPAPRRPVITARWEYPAAPDSPRLARADVARRLRVWGIGDEAVITAELIVTELVTNAVRYAGGPIGVELVIGVDALTCRVADPSPTPPQMRRAGAEDESGRGLPLVDDLATGWGTDVGDCGDGKVVWAEQYVGGGL